MANFKKALEPVLHHEGGYSHIESDRGGETYRGISRKHHPQWDGWNTIDAFKKAVGTPRRGQFIVDNALDAAVIDLYHREYGEPMSVDNIVYQGIANEMMDIGINCGAYRAIKILQRAYNLCNKMESIGADLEVDGVMGLMTLTAVNNYPQPDILVKVMNGLQMQLYIKICEKNPAQEINFLGWLKRC